jgi:hypothetical protein
MEFKKVCCYAMKWRLEVMLNYEIEKQKIEWMWAT